MKKIALMTVVIALLAGCSAPKTVIESKKVIKGYWTLENITYGEAGTFNVTFFKYLKRVL